MYLKFKHVYLVLLHNVLLCFTFHFSIQSLDKGGAITGRATVKQPQQPPHPQQQHRVDSPVPNTTSTTFTSSGGSSLGKRILNSLNVGGAITGPPVSQSSNRYM